MIKKVSVKDQNNKKHTFDNMPVKIEVEVKLMAAPENVRCVSDVNTVMLQWNEYKSAKSFSVYMYDEVSGEYILLGKTSKND